MTTETFYRINVSELVDLLPSYGFSKDRHLKPTIDLFWEKTGYGEAEISASSPEKALTGFLEKYAGYDFYDVLCRRLRQHIGTIIKPDQTNIPVRQLELIPQDDSRTPTISSAGGKRTPPTKRPWFERYND